MGDNKEVLEPHGVSNLVDNLVSLSPLATELQPEVLALRSRVLNTVALDAGHKKPLALEPGQERRTRQSVIVSFNGVDYRARAFQRAKLDGAYNQPETETGLMLWLKDTPSESNHTEVTIYDNGQLLIGTDDSEDGLKNDLSITENIVEKLYEAVIAANSHKAKRRQRRRQRARAFCGRFATITAIGLAVSGAGYGVTRINWGKIGDRISGTEDEKWFDGQGLTLSNGSAAAMGQTVHPAYSPELRGNPMLDYDSLQRVNHCDTSRYAEDVCTSDLSPLSGLRAIIIQSSKDDRDCETIYAKGVKFSDRLVSWTDFSDLDGGSRAGELDVTLYKPGKDGDAAIVACWTGQELNDHDDPRIVVDFQ